MRTQILTDRHKGACLLDTQLNVVFGPLFANAAQADEFLSFCPIDPAEAGPVHFGNLLALWKDQGVTIAANEAIERQFVVRGQASQQRRIAAR